MLTQLERGSRDQSCGRQYGSAFGSDPEVVMWIRRNNFLNLPHVFLEQLAWGITFST